MNNHKNTKNIEDFLCMDENKKTIKLHSSIIEIYGDPLHCTDEELIKKFKKLSIEDFLISEARYAIGNYILIEKDNVSCSIVASPGYAGGYVFTGENQVIVSTILSSLLANISDDIKMDPFGLSFYLNYAPQSNFNLLPFTTMFKNVFRVPSGTYLKITNGKLISNQSYLILRNKIEPPKNFAAAMDELTVSLRNYFRKNNNKKIALMFSGGVDSLILYLTLREAVGKEKIRLYTMEHSTTNGPARALSVAKSLGVDIEIITDEIYEDGKIYKKVSKMMENDILAFKAPHLAFLNMNLKDTIVFHGQNFDAIANIHMEVLQETHEVGYLSPAGMRIANTENRINRQRNAFLKNLQLTDAYLEDSIFQKLTVDYFKAQRKNLKIDPDPSANGILRGLISSQLPNLLSPSKYPFNQVEYLNKELILFDQYLVFSKSEIRTKVDMIRYLTYSCLANKRATTFALSEATRPLFLAMSGPVLSYYLGRPRGLSYASQPKREIYAYAKKLSKQPYRTLIKRDITGDKRIRKRDPEKSEPYALIEESLQLINPNVSLVLKAIKDKKTLDFVKNLYQSIYDILSSDDQTQVTRYQKNLAIRMINLEKIMYTANRLGINRNRGKIL